MESFDGFKENNPFRNSTEEQISVQENEENEKELLKKKVVDLELQLEYAMNQNKEEMDDKDKIVRQLEEKIKELENNHHNNAEKDEAIFQMSEKLLIISNKHDELLKENKLKEEELNHLKNKKKYRNDKTNKFIMELKKQNENQKNEYFQLNEKYTELLKELLDLKKSYNLLKEKKIEEQMIADSKRKEQMDQEDEADAMKILNLRNGQYIKFKNIKRDENSYDLDALKLELEYKDMIIHKLIRIQNSSVNTVSNDTNYIEQINNSEKKIDELYNKYLNAQSDSERYRKQVEQMKKDVENLKEENSILLSNLNNLKNLRNTDPKNKKRINQFSDMLDLVLKENSVLNDEISKQKKKNLKDVYYYNKEIHLLENNKLKIIEKFDHKNIVHPPHLYKPLTVTLNLKDEMLIENKSKVENKVISIDSEEEEGIQNICLYTKNSNGNLIYPDKKNTNMEDLVHIYINDYIEKVFNKK